MNVKCHFLTFVVEAAICMLASTVLHAQPPYPPTFTDARVETYRKIDSTELKLWIFGESDSSAPKPAIVFFFGGGWNLNQIFVSIYFPNFNFMLFKKLFVVRRIDLQVC